MSRRKRIKRRDCEEERPTSLSLGTWNAWTSITCTASGSTRLQSQLSSIFFLARCCSSSLLSFLSYLFFFKERVQEEEEAAVALKVDCPFGPSSLVLVQAFQVPRGKEGEVSFCSTIFSFFFSWLRVLYVVPLSSSWCPSLSFLSLKKIKKWPSFGGHFWCYKKKTKTKTWRRNLHSFCIPFFLVCLSFPFKEIKTKLGFQG